MKIGLVTTTISLPTLLELYRQHGPDVKMFVACDLKTPGEVFHFCQKIDAVCLTPNDQKKWKSSELFGWNTIQRRVFALLNALEWGAEVIVSVDTDDFPMSDYHLECIEAAFLSPFNGLELRANSGWVDPGSLIEPPTPHRGMPVRLDRCYVHPAINRRVGVVASTVLGSCDLAAIDRLVGTPKRSVASELARSGVIVDPARNWTIFNSEAVAYCRELAPAMMVLPYVQRYDDLYASLICQRIMKDSGYVTRLGPPIVWHEREDRDILKDLRGEVWGMSNIEAFADFLEDVGFVADDTTIQRVRGIYQAAERKDMLPLPTIEAALAWLDDCEAVL